MTFYRPQRSWGKVIFSEAYVKNSVGGGWGWWWYLSMHCRWYPSMPCRSPGPHPGGKLKGLAWGDLQAHTWEGSLQTPSPDGESPGPHLGGSPSPHPGGSQHALRQTPSRRLLLRAVSILLECILVKHKSAAVTTPLLICSWPVYLPIKKAKLLKCQKKQVCVPVGCVPPAC